MPARRGMPARADVDVDVNVLALTNAEIFQMEVGWIVMYENRRLN
jgi:hypothetical protein